MTGAIRRALSLLLALAMAMSLAVTAAAADDEGTAAEIETDGANLNDTVRRAESGDTVKLTSDCTTSVEYIPVIDKGTLTIDLGGNTLTFETPEPNQTSGKRKSRGLWVYGTDVTVKNGTIQSTCAGDEGDLASTLYISALVGEDGHLTSTIGRVTLENVRIVGAAGVPGSGYAAALCGGALTVDERSILTSSRNAAVYGFGEAANTAEIYGTVTHTGTFSAVEGSYASTGSMTIKIHEPAQINGGEGAGILQMAPGSVTIDGGSVTGTSSGIAMTKGTLTISGGSVTGTGNYHAYQPSANYKVYDNGAAVYVEPVAAGTGVTVSGGTLTSRNSYALSVPKEGNKSGNLQLSVTGGAFIGGGEKAAVDAGGETGVISGGTFSSPVESSLLAGDLKYEAKKSGAENRAPYSYHQTAEDAEKEAGTDGEIAAVEPETDVSGIAKRLHALQPADGGTKATAAPKEIKAGVYEVELSGTATPSDSDAAPKPAYWIGVGIAPPAGGYTSVAYAEGNRFTDGELTFTLNNKDGSLDDIQDGGEGFAVWLDAAGVKSEGVFYTVKWYGEDKIVHYEVYHFTWSGKLDGELPDTPDKPDTPTTYTVTIASDIANGTVTADKASAAEGETVTLTITPGSGYQLSALTTTPTLTLSGSGNTRTFTMPDSNVTISATFAASGSSGSSVSPLTGYVDIIGEPWVGETLYARVTNTNNTGFLYYQWTANGYNIYGETSRYLDLTGYEVGKTIRCVVTSSVQTGSITGRLWGTVDYYDSRYSPTESPSNSGGTGTNQSGTTEKKDDFTVETPVFTTTANADGTKTTTIIEPDGSSGLVILTSYGTVSSASMTFSSSALGLALRSGSALILPTVMQSSRSAGSAAPVRIVLPQATGSVKVKIPVSQMTAGTVAVMENYFGPDTVIRSSVSESDGVRFSLTGSAVVKIVDNSKSFQDVSDGAWYANAVKWAASREVMTGVSAQRFDPQGTVDRATMAQMLYNFDGAGSVGAVSQFSDVTSKDWYAASVSWATKNGIARNYGDRFGAKDALTREDMAAMLYSYAKAKGYNPYANGNTAAFPDNGDVSDWARPAMQWAVGAGLITGTQNGTRTVVLDPQGTVTRAQLATIMQRFNNLYY